MDKMFPGKFHLKNWWSNPQLTIQILAIRANVGTLEWMLNPLVFPFCCAWNSFHPWNVSSQNWERCVRNTRLKVSREKPRASTTHHVYSTHEIKSLHINFSKKVIWLAYNLVPRKPNCSLCSPRNNPKITGFDIYFFGNIATHWRVPNRAVHTEALGKLQVKNPASIADNSLWFVFHFFELQVLRFKILQLWTGEQVFWKAMVKALGQKNIKNGDKNQ